MSEEYDVLSSSIFTFVLSRGNCADVGSRHQEAQLENQTVAPTVPAFRVAGRIAQQRRPAEITGRRSRQARLGHSIPGRKNLLVSEFAHITSMSSQISL